MAVSQLGFMVASASRAGLEVSAPARNHHEQLNTSAAVDRAWEKLGLPHSLSLDTPAPAPFTLPQQGRLKALVRSGVPQAHRPLLWLSASGGLQLRHALDDGEPGSYYARMSSARSALPALVVSQIQAEVASCGLTWRTHPLITSMAGMQAMTRVLIAIMNHNPHMGYVKSLCHMVAFTMVVFGGAEQQEPVFWTLVGLLEDKLFGYCGGQWLLGLRVEQDVLNMLAARKLPRLTSHLAAMKMTPATFTQSWMSGLYVGCLPPEVCARVWDLMVLEGPKILLRVSLALLKMYEQTLASCTFPEVLRKVLDLRVSRTNDAAALLNVAFKGIGSLPGELVDTLRDNALRAHVPPPSPDHVDSTAPALPALRKARSSGPAAMSGARLMQRSLTALTAMRSMSPPGSDSETVSKPDRVRSISGRPVETAIGFSSPASSAGSAANSGNTSPVRLSKRGSFSSLIARLGWGERNSPSSGNPASANINAAKQHHSNGYISLSRAGSSASASTPTLSALSQQNALQA